MPGSAGVYLPEYARVLCELVVMMSPFCPMFSSELWAGLSSIKPVVPGINWDKPVLLQTWPSVDPDYKLELNVKVSAYFFLSIEYGTPVIL